MGIDVRSETDFSREETAHLARFARSVLASLDRSRWNVSVLIVDDAAIRQLNRQWRRIDRATDVLSFPAGEDPGRLLGDVVISAPRAIAQARRYGVTTTEELRRLLVHGILHLMGYDHVTLEDRRAMRALEEKLLRDGGRSRSVRSASRRTGLAATRRPIMKRGAA